MKKTLLVLALVFVLVAALTVSVFALTSDDDGWYSIGSADELIEFQQLVAANRGAYKAKLTADIDMTGKEWTPFGSVVITFDGQGHTIKGLTRTYEGGGNIGLFADELSNGGGNALFADIVFEDCSLNVTVPNGANVGFFGASNRGSATDIVLKNFDLTVNQTGNGELHVGGLVGRANHQAVEGKYSYASGTLDANCSINVTSTNTNQGYVRVGGYVGACYNTCVVFEGGEMNATITAPNDPVAFIKQLWGTAEIRGAKNNTNLPDVGNASKAGYPIYIFTAQEYIDAVKAINDKGVDCGDKITISADLDFTGLEFVPFTVKYAGLFEGQGHTFSNIHLTYNDVEGGNYGIIAGRADGQAIQNLTIKDSSITLNTPELGSTSAISLGGVVGWSDRRHYEGIALENVDITLNGTLGAIANVGGICGYLQYNSGKGAMSLYECSLDAASSVTVDVDDGFANVAGILGQFYGNKAYGANLAILDCTNYATVTSPDLAAGIVGIGGYAPGDVNKIERCVNYGTIISKGVAASILGTPGPDNVTCTIIDSIAGGFIIGAEGSCGQVYGMAAPEMVTTTNTKVVSIVNPITAGDDIDLSAYYQTQDAGDGKLNIRVLFLADVAYLNKVSELNIKVTFTKNDATVKTYEGKLGGEVYKSVIADGDMYYAPENIVIFGNIFTGIPAADMNGFTITVTDGAGVTVYTGSATLGE